MTYLGYVVPGESATAAVRNTGVGSLSVSPLPAFYAIYTSYRLRCFDHWLVTAQRVCFS